MDELQTAGMLVNVYLHIVLSFDIRFHSLEFYLYVLKCAYACMVPLEMKSSQCHGVVCVWYNGNADTTQLQLLSIYSKCNMKLFAKQQYHYVLKHPQHGIIHRIPKCFV